jgi:hypothetical protein
VKARIRDWQLLVIGLPDGKQWRYAVGQVNLLPEDGQFHISFFAEQNVSIEAPRAIDGCAPLYTNERLRVACAGHAIVIRPTWICDNHQGPCALVEITRVGHPSCKIASRAQYSRSNLQLAWFDCACGCNARIHRRVQVPT